MAFKPIDPKRDEFRRYLERAGVIEALTKVFVRLVKERPENPMEYLQQHLGDSLLQADNLAYLQNELDETKAEIQRLRSIIMSVKPEALLETKEAEDAGTKESNEKIETTETAEVPNEAASSDAIENSGGSSNVNKEEEEPITNVESTLEQAMDNCNIDDAKDTIQQPDNNTNN